MPKIVRFHQTGGAEVLQLEELPTRVPQQGEVRIRVEAIGLNRAELMFRQGAYLEQPQLPSLIGYEASGIVEEVGPGVVDLKPGDKVSSIPSFSMTQYGTYGEVVVLPAYSLAKYPSRLSPVEATAIWMQYLTAYGLVEFGHLHEGDQLLITAAASSVGLAAIQIANALGAKPIATTRNPAKEKALRDAGAYQVVNTGSGKWIEHVREITVGKGVDLAFDPVAGSGLEQIAQIVREEGTIFVYGALASEPTPFPLFAALGKNLTIRGYTLFSIVKDRDRLERAKRWVYGQLSAGTLHPVISRTFALGDIVEAHRYMESNEQIGKIVVTV
ncbi:MAG TPA: zinc-dependent alcohol dehydrogenase family protein [Terrimicrobiaceae bacterium]